MELKGSKTEKNLLTAFAGESQARNRYTYFASQARKDGYMQIADIFEETANQEKEHAKRFFSFLEGGDVEIVAAFPAGDIGTTAENLKAAAVGENYEYTACTPGSRSRQGGGLRGDRPGLDGDLGRRKAAREALPRPRRKHREGQGLQAGRQGRLALPQLRLPARRHRSARSPARPAPIPRPTRNSSARTGNIVGDYRPAHNGGATGPLVVYYHSLPPRFSG